MKTFYNRTQLARALRIAPMTLNGRIKRGEIKADALDGKGNQLFEASKHERKP